MGTMSHDSLYLVETADWIFVHPATFHAGDKFVAINRVTDEIFVSNNAKIIPEDGRLRTISIYGIVGVIRLVAGPYLAFVKSRERVGTIAGDNVIWKMTKFDLIPFRRSLLHLTDNQQKYNATYLDMLRNVVDTPFFYYSNTYDLSHSIQSLDYNPPDFMKQTLVERADDRFIWNRAMLDCLQQFNLDKKRDIDEFCVPIIHGFVSINETGMNMKPFKFILISRRSARRAGTRLFSRGIDEDGNVSNFVESEQIVEFNGEIASFVQIRGSIPLFWTQKPNLKYKPKPLLGQLNHAEAYGKHFQDLTLRYGKITSVNLVNQSGAESVLEVQFKQYHESTSTHNTTYEAFDFHRECRKMNYQRLEVLINRLSNDIDQFGYFLRERDIRVKQQEGVFRTNCIDCLDRTNVVQGLLAKVNLALVLRRMRIFSEHETVIEHPDFEYLFKNVWADNGDIVSTEYSGTGALKADFTRTGKRTIFGLLQDGYNASVRYVKNNFSDGFRQDAIDLFLGNYTVNEKEGLELPCPLEKNRDWKYFTLPILLILSFVMFISVVLFPQEPASSTETMLYRLFWGCMTLACGAVIVHYGTEFVDNPVLSESPKLRM